MSNWCKLKSTNSPEELVEVVPKPPNPDVVLPKPPNPEVVAEVVAPNPENKLAVVFAGAPKLKPLLAVAAGVPKLNPVLAVVFAPKLNPGNRNSSTYLDYM